MNRTIWFSLLFLFLAGCGDDAAEQGETPDFASIVESSELSEGFFDIYRDSKSGETYLAIKPDQIDMEFIYHSVVRDAAPESGSVRGYFRDNKIISIRRHFNRIEFVAENTAFYFDPDNALSRAADANISKAVLTVQDIVSEDDTSGTLLIKADDIFLTESLQQVKPSAVPNPNPAAPPVFALGELSKTKSKIYEVRSYPLNTDVFVDYVYENPAPVVAGQRDVTDSRNVSVRVQHRFVAIPENNFIPRIDDPRVGYFTRYITDLTSQSNAPYRDLITRWHIEKKDADAELSDPVEPIVWWIENTTPVEFRETIKEATLAWNQSFAKASFSNAMQVKVQPDDADWDAGDIRYNVLRWTSSPQPPFGGYGPSFTNPRTGQIIGADIMLEFVFFTNRVKLEKIVEAMATVGASEALAGREMLCSAGHRLQLNNMFGSHALKFMGAGSKLQGQLIDESLRALILHELGHTLGLNHNMKASQMLTIDELSDQQVVDRRGLTGSVMDYTPVNLATAGNKQTNFYNVKPGPYDDWAIEFGYSPALDGADGEAQRNALLNRSTERDLAFGNDADDMRAAGAGIDPRVNVTDLSADAITYAVGRMTLIETIMGDMRGKLETEGESYQELVNAYLILATQFANSATSISRYIGGVYVNRSMVGQPGAETQFVPVSLKDQRRAMAALRDHVFAADAFNGSSDLYSYLRTQRRSFDFFTLTEDPKLHTLILTVHRLVLDHLLNPVVLTRVTDSRLYGNSYQLGIYVEDLTEAIFGDDLQGNVNTFRQNLQLEYVNRLLAMVSGETKAAYDYPSQSVALHTLREIENALAGNRGVDAETRAHRANILYTIRRGLDAKT